MSDVLKHSLDKELLITQAIQRDAEFKDTHSHAHHRVHARGVYIYIYIYQGR